MHNTKQVDGEFLLYESGSPKRFTSVVDFDLTERRFDPQTYIPFAEMWLKRHCHKKWRLECIGYPIYDRQSRLRIYFEDPGEGIFFKLGPQFVN